MDQTNALSKTNDTLVQASQKLIPWWSVSNEKNILKTQTEKSTKHYLNGYYLFPLTEITVNSDCEDIPKFINERYQTILSAAYTAGISVAIIINSKNGKTSVYLGFAKEGLSKNDPELFQSIINGVLPGKKIQLKETVSISSLVDGFLHGGMVTGVPILKKDDEKQRFNISSVVRSLYGKDYTLAIISKPVRSEEIQQSLNELMNIRDELHTLAKSTVGEERGTGATHSTSETKTIQPNLLYSLRSAIFGTNENTANGSLLSIGKHANKGISIVSKPFGIDENKVAGSKGETKTTSEQQSQSLSVEQQNGIALELEKIADQLFARMIQGFNSGFWETAITFAAKERITCDILGGSFVGELSKPNDKLLPPPRLYIRRLNRGKHSFCRNQTHQTQ
ncbi:MAG: hypothetical protein SCARUB_04037 [Candidatus Scalindua rubra]|uniref:Uncharacterized protein n=1 Tax=Candidatus Scalindua rubra TaxID=1872076 RepID=A0A1E3X5K3_9BACT|nr:MAG: hypothetical protein SCARUB_04037 [Candidatus Scalindua rubra]